MQGLLCNGCWANLNHQAYVTECSHIYCQACTETVVGTDSLCPICEGLMSRGNIGVIDLSKSAPKTALWGQAPEAAMSAALSAVNFYMGQQALQGKMIEKKLQNKMEMIIAASKKKMGEMRDAYNKAKDLLQQERANSSQLEACRQELQAKYNAKASQARNIQQQFEKLKQEAEAMRRGSGKSAAMSVRSGGGDHYLMSPGNAQMGQVVTTVHRTQVLAPFSPGSNGALGLPQGMQNMTMMGMNQISMANQGMVRQAGQMQQRRPQGMGMGGAITNSPSNELGLEAMQMVHADKRMRMTQPQQLPLGNRTNTMGNAMHVQQAQSQAQFNRSNLGLPHAGAPGNSPRFGI